MYRDFVRVDFKTKPLASLYKRALLLAHVGPADFWYSTLNKYRRFIASVPLQSKQKHTLKANTFPQCGNPHQTDGVVLCNPLKTIVLPLSTVAWHILS
jgi:hypothetical protein